jgi:regulatory protein
MKKSWIPMVKSQSNDSDPFAAALRVLTRCDRSEAELRNKLKQFGFTLSAIDKAVEKCYEYNYLNDERYARERARSLMRTGRGVGPKIRLELRRRGLSDNHVEQALELVETEFSSHDILRDQLDRRFPSFDYDSADERQRRRVVSYFQRRGFNLGQIFNLLREGNGENP